MENRNFRSEKEDWEIFKTICSQEGKTASKALREFIKRVGKNGNLDYTFKQTTIFDYTEK